MTPARFAVRFDFPEREGPCYAGDYRGAAGFAPTLLTALLFDTAEIAGRFLRNAYGPAREFARVVDVTKEEA